MTINHVLRKRFYMELEIKNKSLDIFINDTACLQFLFIRDFL